TALFGAGGRAGRSWRSWRFGRRRKRGARREGGPTARPRKFKWTSARPARILRGRNGTRGGRYPGLSADSTAGRPGHPARRAAARGPSGRAPGGAAPEEGMALTKGVLKTMSHSKTKKALAVALTLVLAGLGAGVYHAHSAAQDKGTQPDEKKPKVTVISPSG